MDLIPIPEVDFLREEPLTWITYITNQALLSFCQFQDGVLVFSGRSDNFLILRFAWSLHHVGELMLHQAYLRCGLSTIAIACGLNVAQRLLLA